jgi:hypothetical protein
MRFRIFLCHFSWVNVLVFCLTILRSDPALSDVCADKFKDDGEAWFKTLIDEFWKRPGTREAADPIYLFSKRSGFALGYNCVPDGPTRHSKLMYYPTGLFVQKLDKSPTVIGGRDFERVRATYGMEMFIAAENLLPVGKEKIKGFLFVDGPRDVPYCILKDCDDPTKQETDLVLTASSIPNGIGRYGVVAKVTQVGSCRKFIFYPYEDGAEITDESTFLDDCWRGFKERDWAINFVSLEELESRFKYSKRGGFYGDFVEGLLTQANLMFKSRKECQVEDIHEIGGSFKAGGDYYIFSAELSTEVRTKRVRPRGSFYYFSHYYLDGRAFGIESSSRCESDAPVPDYGEFVQVYHKNFNTKFFSLKIQTIINRYKEKYDLAGYSTTKGTHLRRGKYFTICGASQYFYLRNLFRSYMVDLEDVIEGAAKDSFDREEMKFLTDYFAHIVMASSVRLVRNCA